MARAAWERKGVFQVIVPYHCPPKREGRARTQTGRSLEAGAEGEVMVECAYWLSPLACSLIVPRSASPGMALSSVSWALAHHQARQCAIIVFPTGQSGGDIVSTEISFSKMSLAWVDLT